MARLRGGCPVARIQKRPSAGQALTPVQEPSIMSAPGGGLAEAEVASMRARDPLLLLCQGSTFMLQICRLPARTVCAPQ